MTTERLTVNMSADDLLHFHPRANREDPYGEFNHITPVTVRNAALLLRAATKEQVRLADELVAARMTLSRVEKDKQAADQVHKEAMHRLHISALQENGGEA